MNSLVHIQLYRIIAKIGEGEYSTVYEVQDRVTGKSDEIDANNIKLFREIAIITKVSFPSILKYHGFSLKDFYKEDHIVILCEFLKNVFW